MWLAREIIKGLEKEEEALAALAAEVGIEGAGITFATQELSLLSGDTQNLAQVIPFPYQDDTLSEAALNWRKLSSMAQDRNNTGNLAYFPAIADLMFLEGQVAGERIQIWEEIEYERERIRQLAKAESCYTDGAQVVFRQYMDIDSVREAISLTVNGEPVTCTVSPLDAETDTNKESSLTYASRFQVTPTGGGTLTGSVAVTVSADAKSYNEKTLGSNHETSATSPMKASPTGIASSGAVVQLDKTGTLTFTLQPGLSGETLTVESLTPSLVQVGNSNKSQTVTTTGDGTASVTVKGLLPGKGRVMITHAASGLSQVVEVNIVTSAGQLGAPAPVTATVNGEILADGQTVTKGSQVVLSSTERATIRYTLDGTCPKTESALTYGGPISINSDTVLRAVAVTQDGATFGPTARWEIKIAGNDSPSQPSTPSTPTTPDKPKLPFTDLGENQWYESAIEYAYTHDIMEGMSETKFSPNTSLTRAQAVQILYNLEGQPTVTRTTSFADLTTHWAAKPIAWAEQTGVVDGYEDNTFRPENNVTRQEFAQMMYNYAAYKDYDLSAKGDLSQFTDGDSVQEWAVTAMSWANGNALINGHDDGTLEPGGTTTRAQAASILMRFDQNLVEN